MKRILTFALAASFGIAFAGVASAAPGGTATYSSGSAANGIAGSRHNLGGFSKHVVAQETTEICVFCHTPHHTNTGAGAPLWNRGSSASSFTAYGTTLAGTSISSLTPGSVTLACLTCHDGVTTLDNLVNAPGKGGVSTSGASQGWNFYYYSGSGPTSLGSSININSVDARLNIGSNLSNDHPVSVGYNTTAASLRPATTVISSIASSGGLYESMAGSASTFDSSNLQYNLWAVKGFVNPDAKIGDLLRPSNSSVASPGDAYRVECSSCHDPHFANTTGASSDQGYPSDRTTDSGLFLRRVGGNVASAVCRTCHNK